MAWLPTDLPDTADFLWTAEMPTDGLGGISANRQWVIVSGRDLADKQDLFRCFDAKTGERQWQLTYSAPGLLDYGNTPRATPLIHEDCAYLLGAMGQLTCVDIETGEIFWDLNLWKEFDATPLTWGMCNSPLIVDGKLIVQPGGSYASLVALDPETGDVIWQSAGRPAAYSSFIVATFSGQRQIIGYDSESLGGWNIETGQRLWELVPPVSGDFNVPTPIQIKEHLFVATENNGARLYSFNDQGIISPDPAAVFEDLILDTHSPIVIDGKVFAVNDELLCLNADDQLRSCWQAEDNAYLDYASLIGAKDRFLIVAVSGELILVSTDSTKYKLIDRLKLIDDGTEIHSHPALVDHFLYIRMGKKVACLSMSEK